MRLLIIILCLSFSFKSIACSCGWFDRSMEKAYQENAFIALVKIIKKAPLEKGDSALSNDEELVNHYSKVSIEIIELFKGNPGVTILEWGVNSSCDMGIRENEEWILFGNKVNDAFVSVSYCGYWIKMTNALKERYWQYDSGISAMKELRKIAGLPEKINPDGAITTYYPDGNVLATEAYNKGKLQGKRKVYFSNGLLMEESEYDNGMLTGKKDTYANHGQLLNELMFENGEITHSVYWYDTTWEARRMEAFFSDEPKNIFPAKIQKQSEGWFDLKKRSRNSVVYYRSGRIRNEHFAFSNEIFKTTCEYFESGKLKFEIFSYKEGDITEEKKWNESGVLISDKKWIKGKYKGDLIKH